MRARIPTKRCGTMESQCLRLSLACAHCGDVATAAVTCEASRTERTCARIACFAAVARGSKPNCYAHRSSNFADVPVLAHRMRYRPEAAIFSSRWPRIGGRVSTFPERLRKPLTCGNLDTTRGYLTCTFQPAFSLSRLYSGHHPLALFSEPSGRSSYSVGFRGQRLMPGARARNPSFARALFAMRGR